MVFLVPKQMGRDLGAVTVFACVGYTVWTFLAFAVVPVSDPWELAADGVWAGLVDHGVVRCLWAGCQHSHSLCLLAPVAPGCGGLDLRRGKYCCI